MARWVTSPCVRPLRGQWCYLELLPGDGGLELPSDLDPSLTIKVTGHQWYWSYEYTDYENEKIMFDSYMIPEEDLQNGDLRLLEVDKKLWLPVYTHVRVLITAMDVLHSWAIPAFGIKMDAVPGRLNQLDVFIHRSGVFYGQCSEICGIGHGFMPICLYAISYLNFLLGKC